MNDQGEREVVVGESSGALECPHCGHTLDGGEIFCPNCLQRLREVRDDVPQERLTYEAAMVRANPRVPEALKWAGVVLLLAAALVMIWYGWIRPTGEYYLTQGDQLLSEGLFEESLASYERALEMDPELARAYLQEGQVFYRLARDEDAIAAFQRALLLDPSLAEAYVGLGKTYYYTHNFEASRENLLKAQQLMPERRDIYAFLGGTYLEESRSADALQLLEKAIELNPEDTKAHFDLGRARFALTDYDGAASALESAIQLVPDNFDAQRYLAESYQHLGRNEDALAIWQALVEIAPDDLWVRSALAKTLSDLGDYDAADAEFEKVIAMAGKTVPLRECYLNLGWSKYKQGAFEDAIKQFQAAYTLDISQADVFGGIGLALSKLDRCTEAVSPLEYALTQSPDWAEVRQALDDCTAQQ